MKVAFFLLVMLMMVVCSASAQIYRYVDPQGNVLYTDDLLKVPADQRSRVQQYGESQSPQIKTPSSQPPVGQPAAKPTSLPQPPITPKQLNQQRQALEKLHKELQEEKKLLEMQRKSVHTFPQHIQFKQKAMELEKKIQAYDAQRQAYDQAVEQYNAWANRQKQAPLSPAPSSE